MAASLAPNNARRPRKRKADEAQIDPHTESQDLKRLKIVTPVKSPRPKSIIPNENTDAPTEAAVADASEFEALLNASDSDVPETTPADNKMLDQIPDTIPEETSNASNALNASNGSNAQSDKSDPSGPSKQTEQTEQSKNPEIAKKEEANDGFQWGGDSNANTGFGTFDSSNGGGFGSGFGAASETGFGSFANSNSNGTESNGFSGARPGGWGTPREFVFGADSSNFSFAELDKNEKQKNKAQDDEDKKEEFGFPDHFGEDPVAKLAGKEVDAGDAADKTVYEIKGRIYELDAEKNCYKERGIGEVKLNTYSAGEDGKVKARLLCRREITLKTIMNAIITKETQFDKATAKTVRFTVFEQQLKGQEDAEIVPKSYLLKLQDPDNSKMDKLIAEIEKIQEQM